MALGLVQGMDRPLTFSNWRIPLPLRLRFPLASRPGLPEPGLVLRTQRGHGKRCHAVLVFPLDDLWTFAAGLRSLCFTRGGPWRLEVGFPSCKRCRAILRRLRASGDS